MSLSVAVKYKPSFFNSNLIPFNTGIIFLVDKALLTGFNPTNNTFFSIYNFLLNILIIYIINIIIYC